MSNSTERLDDGMRPAPLVVRAIDGLSNLAAYVAAVAVVLLVVEIVVDVVGRMVFNAPFPGTIEHTTYWWMPALALLAFGYTELRQEHIKVTMLLDALPLRMRQIIDGAFCLITTLILVALAYYTWHDAVRSYNFDETTASSPPVLVWPFRFVAVAAMIVFALQSAVTTWRYFAGQLPKQHEYDTEADFI
jgi:TRAP-type mannitol/chloroaromatic compound transport system permease small subunit